MSEIHCPYGDEDCPKVKHHIEETERMSRKLDFLIIVVVALHGAEILAVLGVM